MPKLQYTTGSGDLKNGKQVLEDPETSVKFHASFDKSQAKNILHKMKFVLAKYDIYGDFKGFDDLTHQLFLCDVPDDDIQRLITIGTTMETSCSFDLTKLLNEKLTNIN